LTGSGIDLNGYAGVIAGDKAVAEYNEARPHQGRWCYGKTPMRTFVDSIPLAQAKMLSAA
jgi:hypothetical protein